MKNRETLDRWRQIAAVIVERQLERELIAAEAAHDFQRGAEIIWAFGYLDGLLLVEDAREARIARVVDLRLARAICVAADLEAFLGIIPSPGPGGAAERPSRPRTRKRA